MTQDENKYGTCWQVCRNEIAVWWESETHGMGHRRSRIHTKSMFTYLSITAQIALGGVCTADSRVCQHRVDLCRSLSMFMFVFVTK